jgi:hypothetical protein
MGRSRSGSVLVSVLVIAMGVGSCASAPKEEGTIESSSADLLASWDGWLDRDGLPPVLTSDPTAPSGGLVQQIARTVSGGDYFSPWLPVVGAELLRARGDQVGERRHSLHRGAAGGRC